MLLEDFDFQLPQSLIAQQPSSNRGDARLLAVNMGSRTLGDNFVHELPSFLNEGDLLVLNDTKVIPARLYARKKTGGKVEILVERVLSKNDVLVRLRANRALKVNDQLEVMPVGELTITQKKDLFCIISSRGPESLEEIFRRSGHVPLPPYIKRADSPVDIDRYQTIFASKPGAIAAPTAGLHITKALLDALAKKRIDVGFLTLHIGSGTYLPIKSGNLNNHQMHEERIVIGSRLCKQITSVKKEGGRIFAVGTTVLRALETIARSSGRLKPYTGETRLFIRPGFRFNVVDCLLTNFHMPKSTLFVLLSAFGGIGLVQKAYEHAIKEKYLFYSYGDAMLIPKSIQD